MAVPTLVSPIDQLLQAGLHNGDHITYQASPEELVNSTLQLDQGNLSDTGALVIHTGKFTGRSPKDRFIVKDISTADTIDWNSINLPIDPTYFDRIFETILSYLDNQPRLWVRDCIACADERFRIGIRVVTDKPWMNLFAHNMFLRPAEEELDGFRADWHIFTAPDLQLDPSIHGIPRSNAAVISFKHRMILIAGTGYTGEMKKGIFSVLNFLLPQQQVLSMHCAANKGEDHETALFFGLSGTGKTTLSADPSRELIGDDEHGWTSRGIFNFEGGCYAKCIGLSPEKEPDIFNAITQGALVENTVFHPGSNRIDFDDASITENTRVSYPLDYIANAADPSLGSHPKNIFFLTCDAYGVLPPISKLNEEQAMYQFISGYTAKIAGTEAGITEPKAVFSACFGAPFLPLHAAKYASLLGQKLKEHRVNAWLVNTGWTGGEYGKGQRIPLKYTRALINAALNGDLEGVTYKIHPVFKLAFPAYCRNLPGDLLDPVQTWDDAKAYEAKAKFLAQLFIDNFIKYAPEVSPEIMKGQPTID